MGPFPDRGAGVLQVSEARGQRSRLLGRVSEREVLDGLLGDIRQGNSRTLLLRGEAGIGKTTLLQYLIDSARDLTVVRATGVESEMELAFATLHQLCGPLLGHLPLIPDPQREALEIVFGMGAGPPPDRFLVGLAVLSLFSEVAEQGPLLCVVDDAHWLDQASALTLAFVARRLLAEPVGLVFASREPSQELQQLPELEVLGLRSRDAHALLDSVVRVVLDDQIRERIIAETRGNPLALIELPQGLTGTQLAGGFGILDAPALRSRIRESFVRRLDTLPDDSRRLMLLAAAEPVGDPVLLWRAAGRLGLDPAAADELESHALMVIGDRVTFRHPLVRSAVYRSATAEERRAINRALAETTDPEAHPDRRAWHLAAAALGPDEAIAVELERSAGRAQARGGVAAAAAFLQRAVAMTQDPERRVGRALAAAHASLQAGAFEEASRLAATAEAWPLDSLDRARVELVRAQIEFASSHDSAAPAMLLRALKRIEPLDAGLARAGYLEALSAALFAARLAVPDAGPQDVAQAVKAAPPAASPPRPADLLLESWARLFADGCAEATPSLREALDAVDGGAMTAELLPLFWLVTITAPVVWDDGRWEDLSRLHVEVARSSGALSELPLALNSRIYLHLFRGQLDTAARLIDEADVVTEATGAGLTQWGSVALAALRGREDEAVTKLDSAEREATARGEGIALTVIAWARTVLYNGLGVYGKALAAATQAINCPTNSAAAAWGMVELVEAAARADDTDTAREASARFTEIANAAGSDWALGISARSQALLTAGPAAEELYREALDHLERCLMRVDLARAHLLYGEWLRRENRRIDARAELQIAHDQFESFGIEAFAHRARIELAATGERVRERTVETRDDLTAQELQIAEMARDGLSNPEIGVRLFLSPRTVEWHLRKVFIKLGIKSRADLRDNLPSVKLLLT